MSRQKKPSAKKIIFRVDSSAMIGAGHLMRCLSLADHLRNRGYGITFICRSLVGDSINLINEKYFKLKILPRRIELSTKSNLEFELVDARDTLVALVDPADLIIVDHYGLGLQWHKTVAQHTKKIMVIDDLANRNLSCDILLDQTYNRNFNEYLELLSPNTINLLGTDYALLNENFSIKRQAAYNRRLKFRGIKKILINFGGSDFHNRSSGVLKIIEKMKFKNDVQIDVILGNNTSQRACIEKFGKRSEKCINVHNFVSKMAHMMTDADIAIGAGGSSSWERCCLGLPAILFVDADNQALIAKNLERAGAIFTLGHGNNWPDILESRLTQLDQNIQEYKKMSYRAFNICDGLGVKRVGRIISEML